MTLPADPIVTSQWYLNNTGQRGAPGLDLNLLPIWGRYSGKGLIVAVNDDGMDLTHPDLLPNLLVDRAYDGSRETLGQGFVDAPNSHGTVVGSIVGMVAGNGIGGTGIAWGAKIVPALNSYEPGKIAKVFLSNLASNAAVSVNSWGDDQAFAENFGAAATASDRAWSDAITRCVTEGRGGLGMVICVSGGNERGVRADTGLSSFTGNKFTITVAALTHEGKPTDYSSQGTSLLVTALGGVASEEDTGINRGFGVASADVSGSAGYNKAEGEAGNYAFHNQGTSYSQPMVAAITALMLEANPGLGFRDVSSILALTARKTDPTNETWVQQKGTEWNLGGMHFSRDFGYGLVDAAAAVRLAESWAGGTNTVANWVSVEGVSATASGAIPDNPPSDFFFNATATVTQAITIERLEVDIGLTAALPNQLSAVLVSPSGTVHTLFDRPLTKALEAPGPGQAKVPVGAEKAWPGVFTMGITAFMGETSAGTWTLRLLDSVTGETATFNSFTVRAWGQAASTKNQYVFTDEFSGTHTLTDTAGVDVVNAAAVSGPVVLSLAAGATNTLPNGSFTLAEGTVIENAFGGAGNDRLTGSDLNNHLRGNDGNDTLSAGGGDDVLFGGLGSDTLEGGAGYDIASWLGMDTPIQVDMRSNTVTQGSDTDVLSGIEVIFGSRGNDTLRGADASPEGRVFTAADRSDTMRGGLGNDTLEGGGGNDTAEFTGNRAGYRIERAGNVITVTDTDPSNGDDGVDRLVDVERLMFADGMVAFGSRAEELARVAFVLWTPDIIQYPSLFSRGYSFFDNGYDFQTLCTVALQFWPQQGAEFAQILLRGTPGTTRTQAELLQIMADAGGGDTGRAAALAVMANDPVTSAQLEAKNVITNGVLADLSVPGFGTLFQLWPGP